MPYCANEVSFGYVAASVVAILVLAYVGLRPQNIRQKHADDKFLAQAYSRYRNESEQRLKDEYSNEIVAKFSTRSDKERAISRAEDYVTFRTKAEFENKRLVGEFKPPAIRRTDARLIVIGGALSVLVVISQTIYPAC